MNKAIYSKTDLFSESSLAKDYMNCVVDIIYTDKVQKLKSSRQHIHSSRLQHSINVSYYSFCICRKFKWDYRSAARSGLLHDLYFYDWRTDKLRSKRHVSWHPHVALDNAKKICNLNDIEENAIIRHMWPLTLVPPKYKEAYVVTGVDKVCAVLEASEIAVLRFRSFIPFKRAVC